MTTMKPVEAARRLRRAIDRLPGELARAGRAGLKRWSGRAVSKMRDAKGEGRRSSEDRGPLRIVTGGYARALTGGRGGGVQRVESGPKGVRLVLGADPDRVPQVYNEVGSDNLFGRDITLPARPTIEPALRDELPEIEGLFRKRIRRLLTRA